MRDYSFLNQVFHAGEEVVFTIRRTPHGVGGGYASRVDARQAHPHGGPDDERSWQDNAGPVLQFGLPAVLF